MNPGRSEIQKKRKEERRPGRSEKGDHICGGYYRLTNDGLRRSEVEIAAPFLFLSRSRREALSRHCLDIVPALLWNRYALIRNRSSTGRLGITNTRISTDFYTRVEKNAKIRRLISPNCHRIALST